MRAVRNMNILSSSVSAIEQWHDKCTVIHLQTPVQAYDLQHCRHSSEDQREHDRGVSELMALVRAAREQLGPVIEGSETGLRHLTSQLTQP
jgi:hypothetical protein